MECITDPIHYVQCFIPLPLVGQSYTYKISKYLLKNIDAADSLYLIVQQ